VREVEIVPRKGTGEKWDLSLGDEGHLNAFGETPLDGSVGSCKGCKSAFVDGSQCV
jgi:hypothetical protein